MPTEPYSDAPDDEQSTAPGQAGAEDLAALREQRDELHDRWLRSVAEFDNYRRRTERERREFAEGAAADLIGDLLPILDDFERALNAAAPRDAASGEAYQRGVELIYRALVDTLKKHGAEPFSSVGEQFDPTLHEAVMQGPADGHRDGEVLEEFRRGYRLRSRLLRPAQVKVAKA